jgi:aryl-alcohol dehydrogenase-like predicted oxidoreductase
MAGMESSDSARCSRRNFLKTAALSTAALAVDAAFAKPGASMMPSNPPVLPRRPYGRTGIQLSIIGMGGIVVQNAAPAHANRLVAEFVERGVNYFDVAPSYGDAEQKLGPALEPHRQKVFLACKTTQRHRAGASAELQHSLATLRTDYFDLYQLHAVTDVAKDIDAVFARGGAMEACIEAKKSGQVRHLGFSAHSVAAALAAMDRYEFDSILFPVNFATYHTGNFGPQIMERAQAKGLARLALKALARQKWPPGNTERQKYPKCWYQPLTDAHEAELALRFTLSQPVTAALPPGDESLFRLALGLAEKFRPLSEPEAKELQSLAAGLDPVFRAT